MRATVIGVLCGAALAVLAGGLLPVGSPAFADRNDSYQPETGGLIAVTAAAGDDRQQLTVVDPRTRVVSVYHIDLSNGEISLKSVRNINWDLQMLEFNGVSPLPHEIRSSMSEVKRRGE